MRRRCDLFMFIVGPRASLAALFVACLTLFAPAPSQVRAQEVSPSRGTSKLLELIPADSGLVVTVDDLRGQWKEIASSPIFNALSKTSPIQDWLRSDRFQEQQASREQVERILNLTLEELRDEILGDAFVLSLHLPPEASDPNEARGLLVLRAQSPEKLARVIETMNEAQKNNGEIATIAHRKHGDVEFSIREYPPGAGKPDEAYVSWPDGIFALSNSEALIRDAIDRKAGKSGGSTPSGGKPALDRFREVDRRLPDRALLRAFLDPRVVERLLRNAPAPKSPGEVAIRKSIEAHEAVGAALVMNGRGIALDVAEAFDAKKLAAIAGRELGGMRPARIERLPDGTFAVAAWQVDFAGLYELFRRSLPGSELPRVENMEAVARGLLLGHDLRTEILPGTGPQATLVVGEPESWDLFKKPKTDSRGVSPLPLYVTLELGTREVADALDNAIQTCLALASLESRKAGGKPGAVVSDSDGRKVRTLAPLLPAFFAVDRDGLRAVLGSSTEVVSRALAAAGAANAPTSRFRQIQSAEFPSAQSFLCVDLSAVHALIAGHGDAIAERVASDDRRRETVRKDLSRLDEILGLFDSASWGARFEKEHSALIQELRLTPGTLTSASKR